MKEPFNPFNQPVFWLALACILGLLAGFYISFTLQILFFTSSILFFVSSSLFWFTRKNPHAILVLFRNLTLLASFTFLTAFYSKSQTNLTSLHFPSQQIQLKGHFTTIDRKPGLRGSAEFFVDSLKVSHQWLEGNFKVLFYTDSMLTPIIREGIGFEVEAQVTSPAEPDNFGEFNYRDYLESNHILGLILPENISWLKANAESGSISGQLLGEVRFWIETQISNHIPTRDGQGFVRGLLLGYRSWMPPESVQAYSVTGTLHILSVSGLHVGFVTLLLFSPWVRVRYWFPFHGETFRVIFTISGLFIYGWLTGWSASMVRAVVMSSIVLLSILKQGKSTGWSSLFFAFILMIAYDPIQATQPGFLLSFGAVAGLLFADRILPRKSTKALGQKLLSPLKLTLFAIIATSPVTVLFFQNLPVTGALANLIVIPATSLVMMTGFLSVIISSISVYLASVFGTAASFIVYLMQEITTWFSRLPLSGMTVSFETQEVFILIFGIVTTLVLYGITLRKVVLFSGIIVIGFILAIQTGKEKQTEISFMSCGQGDLMWILSPDGHLTLIDAGPVKKDGRQVSELITNRLKYWGKSNIDLVIITHPHLDHYGGLIAVSSVIPIKTIILGDTCGASPLFQKTIANFRQRGTSIQLTGEKKVIKLGLEEKLYLFDPQNLTRNMNDKSFLIRYQYRNFSLLSAGDLEKPIEKLLVSQVTPEWFNTTVIKVSHHGSKTSSSDDWMGVAQAKYAVISAGLNNRYRLPVAEIEEKWVFDGSELLQTQKSGEIRFLTDGETITVETKKASGKNQKSRGDKI
ncbi:MAG: DNA internalization-related competence protein ComEC/Rec2 [Bacteroidetes bacterium]|nr:DNA internalization-related competence protein ComEC/Rec2 [Bacteroidota bacterium]